MLKKLGELLLPRSVFFRLSHYKHHGYWPSLRQPNSFSEKILLRKLRPISEFSLCSDKYLVKDYVKARIDNKHIIESYAVCETLTPEVYDSLPHSFVMKNNRGSGMNLIVKNKKEHSFEELFEISEKWKSIDPGRISKEPHYSLIKPMTIFEELLKEEGKLVPTDYKIHCFRKAGEFKYFIQVDHDRFVGQTRDIYDADWNKLDLRLNIKNSDQKMEKPKNLELMASLAEKISEGFDYVRVDFYNINGKIYFGEMTFTPEAGTGRFYPKHYDFDWGKLF